jgi:DNA-binding LacI/PurR family transcriptional regulator
MTTISQPLESLGEITTRMLVDRIREIDREIEIRTLDVQLIPRDSTGPCQNNHHDVT